MTVVPLALEDRPHTAVKAEVEIEIDATSRWNSEPATTQASRVAAEPLSMAGVTSSLQLLLAARRAQRIARKID